MYVTDIYEYSLEWYRTIKFVDGYSLIELRGTVAPYLKYAIYCVSF